MFVGTNLTLISDVDQTQRCIVRMKDPLFSDALSPSTYKKDKTKIV